MLTDQDFANRPFILIGKELFDSRPKDPSPFSVDRLSYARAFELRESEKIRRAWDIYYVCPSDENPEIWRTLESYGIPATRILLNVPIDRQTQKDIHRVFNLSDGCYATEVEKRYRLQGKKIRSSIEQEEFLASLEMLSDALSYTPLSDLQ